MRLCYTRAWPDLYTEVASISVRRKAASMPVSHHTHTYKLLGVEAGNQLTFAQRLDRVAVGKAFEELFHLVESSGVSIPTVDGRNLHHLRNPGMMIPAFKVVQDSVHSQY